MSCESHRLGEHQDNDVLCMDHYKKPMEVHLSILKVILVGSVVKLQLCVRVLELMDILKSVLRKM